MSDIYPTPLDDAVLATTWGAVWLSLAQAAPAGLQAELVQAWSGPHRHYHDQRNLSEGLAPWTRWRGRGLREGGVETAVWFSDAIYGPQAGSNELIGAAWAARSLDRAGADSDTAQRLHDLAVSTEQATQHDAPASPGSSPDAPLADALSRLAQ